MTDRPIIFSAPMVLAWLEGRKGMTRRLLYSERLAVNGVVPASATALQGYPQPRLDTTRHQLGTYWTLTGWHKVKPSDRLWVRENWGCPEADRPGTPDGRKPKQGDRIVLQANPADSYQWQTGHPGCADFCWRPSIHMPRWASRLTLVVTAVKIERLLDISGQDCFAEGVPGEVLDEDTGDVRPFGPAALMNFGALWERLHGPGSWLENPWVVAISADVHKCNINAMPKEIAA